MGKFDGYMICSDVDGTLIDKPVVSPENLSAISRFQEEGGVFTIVSGRSPQGIRQFLKNLPLRYPVVCYNGAAIYDYEKESFTFLCPLEEDALEPLVRFTQQFPFTALEIYRTQDFLSVYRPNEATRWHLDYEGLTGNVISDFKSLSFPWIKAMFVQKGDETKIVRAAIDESEFFGRFTFVQSEAYFYEILNPSIDKGVTMLRLAESLGISPEKVIAVGDNENDISMIQKAGCGLAVANARQMLKDAADYVTVSNKEHVIAHIVNKLDELL